MVKGIEQAKKKLAELEKVMADNRLYHFDGSYWKPNPPQVLILEAWKDPSKKVFSFCGANRIGKCVTYETLIETPDGEISVGKLFENKKSFSVYSWDGIKRVIAKAKAPFKKEGLHECYRINISDGRWIEAADKHRVFCSDGEYHNVSTLASLFPSYLQDTLSGGWLHAEGRPSLQESNSEHGLSILPSGAVHLSGKQLNYLDDYFESFHQYDEQLQKEEESVRAFFPLQGDVLQHDEFLLRLDDLVNKCTNSRQLKYGLLSILDDLHHFLGQYVESLSHNVCNTLKFFCEGYQLFPKLSIAEASGLQLNPSIFQHQSFSYGSYYPPINSDNRIISIKPIGVKECYDFEVEKYHNYYAGGLINHNTTIGIVIALSTLFGKWLWTDEEIVFPHKEPRKVRYIGQGWESHVKAVVEPELKKLWPKSRRVETKKNNQGVDYLWKDLATGSVLEILSNNQESESMEGWFGDLIVYDEPPKRNNRVAAARGLVDRKGRELFVATLLSEAWIHREVIKARLPDGSPDLSVFNVNADISANVGYGLTQEGVDQFAKTLRENEKEARLFGKPAYLGNLVLPAFSREIHLRDRFKVPLNWLVDVSIDFHPSKKWAVLFVATDPKNYHYAVDFIHENGNPKYIAEEIVRKAKQNDYFLNSITIDPLSKGDANAHIEADTVYKIIEKVLRAYNYKLETASKDKDNGISILNEWLMSENELPSLFFFKDMGTVIEQIEDWMYDPDTLKPSKENDDFCEVLYRIALRNTQWKDPYKRHERLNTLPPVDMGKVAFG